MLQHLIQILLELLLGVLDAILQSTTPPVVPFGLLGRPPTCPGRPEGKGKGRATGNTGIGSPGTVRGASSVTNSRKASAEPEVVVQENMSVWAAGDRTALGIAQSASPNWHPVQVLKINFWSHWLPKVVEAHKADVLLNGIRLGVPIGRQPAESIVESKNWPSALEHRDKVSEIIRADLEAGKLLGPFSVPPFEKFVVSPLGAIPKRGGDKIRLIHDLSYPASDSVNLAIDPEDYSLHYSSIDVAVAACAKFNDPILANIDIKDAYKAVGVAKEHWHLLGLKWQLPGVEGSYYFGKVLSFGLRSAPALFDDYANALEKVMPLAGVKSEIVRYVDDFLLVGGSVAQVEKDLEAVIEIARAAGFTIQSSKVTSPCKILEFLGIVIDLELGILKISEQRLCEVKSILAGFKGVKVVSKRRLLKLVGKLAFAARVVRTGRAFLGRLIGLAKSAKALHHKLRLSAAARADISWWLNCIESHNGTCIMKPDWSVGEVLHIFTDASDFGYGAVFGDMWFAMQYTGQAGPLGKRSINWRELHVAVKALATWATSLANRKVIFHIDNQTTCFILNKLYTPVQELMELVRMWCLLVEEHSITTAVVYINTKLNVLADALSRGDMNTFNSSHTGVPRRVWPSPMKYFNESV